MVILNIGKIFRVCLFSLKIHSVFSQTHNIRDEGDLQKNSKNQLVHRSMFPYVQSVTKCFQVFISAIA